MSKKAKKESRETQPLPLGAVPHLFNEAMLKWQKAQFDALKAIYEKLDELLEVKKKEK